MNWVKEHSAEIVIVLIFVLIVVGTIFLFARVVKAADLTLYPTAAASGELGKQSDNDYECPPTAGTTGEWADSARVETYWDGDAFYQLRRIYISTTITSLEYHVATANLKMYCQSAPGSGQTVEIDFKNGCIGGTLGISDWSCWSAADTTVNSAAFTAGQWITIPLRADVFDARTTLDIALRDDAEPNICSAGGDALYETFVMTGANKPYIEITYDGDDPFEEEEPAASPTKKPDLDWIPIL